MATKKVAVRGITALKGSTSAGRTPARAGTGQKARKRKPVAKKRRSSSAKTAKAIGSGRKPAVTKSDRKSPAAKGVQGLLARAEKARAQAHAQALEDVALIKKLLRRVKRDFYEIGLALARLEPKSAYVQLGYESFAALVRDELGMSPGWAREIASVVEEIDRDDVETLGVSKAVALVKLCRVTDAADRAADLVEARVPLPNGEVLDVATASVREVKDAATSLRRARQPRGQRPRGLTTTPAERARVKKWEAAMRKIVSTARVTAVPTPAGTEAEVRIEGVPLSGIQAFCAIFCE